MSITAADIQNRLPQEGEKLATDTICDDWIVKATKRIAVLDTRIGGNDLDSLLLIECVSYGLEFLGLDASGERLRFTETLKGIQARLNTLKDPASISEFKVYRAGQVPDVWSSGGRWK